MRELGQPESRDGEKDHLPRAMTNRRWVRKNKSGKAFFFGAGGALRKRRRMALGEASKAWRDLLMAKVDPQLKILAPS